MPFCQKTFDFLFENHLEDNRNWFEAHKADYVSYVLEPFQQLVTDLTPAMLQIDNQFVTEPKVGRTLSRLRRDTRFTKDPSLYRDYMWLIFKRHKLYDREYPGIYFSVGGAGFDYGCGFYQASPSYMSVLRRLVLEDASSFRKAAEAFQKQSCYHIEGECYKRPRFLQQPEYKRIWLERRNICLVAESQDRDLLFSKDFSEKLEKNLKLLAPIYGFFLEAAIIEQQETAATASVQQHGLSSEEEWTGWE